MSEPTTGTTTSVPLLLLAAAGVGIAHSILPDHWVPLAVIARANRWSLGRTAKVSFLASLGHVSLSLALGVALAAAGLALRNAVIAEERQIVGGLLILTGIGFLIWALLAGGHGHGHGHGDSDAHGRAQHGGVAVGRGDHEHAHGLLEAGLHDRGHGHDEAGGGSERSQLRGGSWLAGIAVPFGVAASPDLTILPVFLAASTVGLSAAIGTLITFALATMGVFVVLTVAAAAGGYQVHWPWLENNGYVLSALMLLVIGVLVLFGL